jgi:phosphoribosyl 1,2-cyclic phosphodiesterase
MGELRVQSLGSGSSGNALLIESEAALVAVDCGLGPRGLGTGLAAMGRSISDLAAVLLTHEHSDHASGLGKVLAAGVPIVCTAGTARAAGVPPSLLFEATGGREIAVAGMAVTPLTVSHDAAEPTGFRIVTAAGVATVLTDLGRPDEALCAAIAESDLVVLEANHDVDMLRAGPYPAYLKRRVLSDSGHLSNADCAELLTAAFALRSKQRTVWLAHLSQTNNRPALAVRTVEQRLAQANLAASLAALPRRGFGPRWSPETVQVAAIQMAMPGF